MKYYWSCWFSKDELLQYGADNLQPAMYWLNGTLIPYRNNSTERYWCFTAGNDFASLLKLAKDKSIAEISVDHFDSIVRGEQITITTDSPIGKGLVYCSMDF